GHRGALHAEGRAERPAGVVIGALLGILRAPVLVVEHLVRNPAVGLVHPEDVASRREGARDRPRRRLLAGLGRSVLLRRLRRGRARRVRRLGRLLFLLLRLLLAHFRRREGGGRAGDLAALGLA